MCNVTSCNAPIKEFARKDHLVLHMRDRHDNYYCPMNHCPRGKGASFATPDEVAVHILVSRNEYSYECALGACAEGSLSMFSSGSLYGHLRSHHGFTGGETDSTWMDMLRREGRTVKQVDRPSSVVLRDCKPFGAQDRL